MDNKHLDSDFFEIEELFEKYVRAVSVPNNESLVFQLRQKIVIKFYTLIEKSKTITDQMKGYSDIMLEKTLYCLKVYIEKEPEEFCKLTYSAIKKALFSKVDVENFEDKTGMSISEHENRKRKKIQNEFKNYERLSGGRIQDFIEYAEKNLNYERKELEKYLVLNNKSSLYAEINNEEDNGNCLIDTIGNSSPFNDYSDSNDVVFDFNEKLSKLSVHWNKQKQNSKKVLSELLTRDLLSDISNMSISEELLTSLREADFCCNDMVDLYMDNKDYKLPTQQEIGIKYGLEKSAVSVKLKRFLLCIKEN